jgi:penicillin-binding protein 1B
MSSKGRRKQKPKGRKRGAHKRVHWGRLALAVSVLVLLMTGGYATYLSQTVRTKFDGKRWAEPARVYARPLELYVGAPIDAAQLQAELEFLGYRRVAAVSGPAQWSRDGNRFAVHTRGFTFWDGHTAARAVVLEVGGGGITRLVERSGGRAVDLLRLEPGLVGSIYPAHAEDRVLVRRDELPASLVEGLLAVEDRRFFEHGGVDLRGIARAVVANLRAGRAVQGGSTLTQQLVKNFILTPERSLTRKINEALLAMVVEARYGKDEILEAYANEIFLGQDGARAIHGFGLAAHFYFQRPLAELRLHETALLVGLVKGASFYNPRRHPQRARERRDLVLEQMAAQGFITPETAAQASARPLGVSGEGGTAAQRMPAFVDLVRRQLRRDYREEDLTSTGLRIFTTLDPWVERQASAALADRLAQIERDRGLDAGSLEGAVVVVSPQNGEVLAVVGGRRAAYAGFNRALDAVRPIGSLVKPAVYLTALTQPERFTLKTRIDDKPVDLTLPGGQRWQPRNYDREIHGEVMLHEALAQSYNLATIDLGMTVGLGRVVDTLRALGVEREVARYPSLLLGALSLSPFETAQMYQTIAAGGFRAPLRAIREVLGADLEPLQRYPLEVVKAVDAAPVFLLNRNLVEVTRSGTARALRWLLPDGLDVAGKTGTTNDLRDSWFAGFSADLLAVAWVGRDDNAPTGLTGASGALRVWADLVKALDPIPLQLAPPASVEYHWVDAQGRLARQDCAGAVAYPFIAGSQPRVAAPCLETQQPTGGFWRGLFE